MTSLLWSVVAAWRVWLEVAGVVVGLGVAVVGLGAWADTHGWDDTKGWWV